MFFQEKINIKKSNIVLEIGPGGFPYYKSDILFDKFYGTNEEIGQTGGTGIKTLNKPLIVCDNKKLPFKDKSFDYLICSHVLEHIPINEVDLFISEINRISKNKYIEFPSIFYEYLLDINEHKLILFIDEKNNTIYVLDKKNIIFNYTINKYFKKFLSEKYGILGKFILLYKRFFFIGKEFNGDIKIKIVTNLNDIPDKIFPKTKVNLFKDIFNLIKYKILSKNIKNNKLHINDLLSCPNCNNDKLYINNNLIICNNCNYTFNQY